MTNFKRYAIFLLHAILAQIFIAALSVSGTNFAYGAVEYRWAGQLRVIGEVSWPDHESLPQPVNTGPYYDGHGNFRLMNMTFFTPDAYFETHYELIFSGGDTFQKNKALEQRYPDLFKYGVLTSGILSNEISFFDFDKIIYEGDDYILYHRLDRFLLALQPNWGSVRIGRQALTWGNGLIFNPMDLLNPFAPTNFVRDYKVGEDMIAAQLPVSNGGDIQFVYVPRRNPANGDVQFDPSSLAGKLHVAAGTTEFDIMVAKDYTDQVIGLGSAGYLKDAAWRLDATYTFLDTNSSRDGFLSLVANMDYSWVWWEKNFYGLMEFYYNGLCNNQYSEELADPDIIARLARGQMFTLGRTYLNGSIEIELHPLFNIYLTVINNLADPSGIIQPRAIWDVAENFQLTFGTNIAYGGEGTEFGGFKAPQTDFIIKSPDSAYVWVTYFF